MFKTIGILAHVDAGKTTFSEQLLYHAKEVKTIGRVDHQDAFLDSHTIEKERGITVFSDQATFIWGTSTVTLIDTPGHIDFSPEMERSIQVMDMAVLIISAVDGIQGHTETVWKLLRKNKIPTCIFINKTDREESDLTSVLSELHAELSSNLFDLSWMDLSGDLNEEGIEWIAERDENLLHTYVEKGYEKHLWVKTLKNMIKNEEVFPCTSGSALKDIGVHACMDKMELLTETSFNEESSFTGRVYKIRHDNYGNRQTYIKAMTGKLHVRDEVAGSNNQVEKITNILSIQGGKFVPVQTVRAGELFAVTGLSSFTIGDMIGEKFKPNTFDLVPTLKAKVIHDSSVHAQELLHCLRLLDEEEPSLQVEWDEYFQVVYVRIMGLIQLEILEKIIEERFDYKVSFGNPEILYKETIKSEVIGYGHFEPLRHYAEVHLKIEPAQRGNGVSFSSMCHPNVLANSYQNLIKQYVLEQDHHGLLTGAPLTDVHCTLLVGRADQEHTSGGDFREATHRAIRQGLEKAHNIILEPYYDFSIKVEQNLIGRILSDVQQASGTFGAPESTGKYVHVSGRVPVATFMDYPPKFASLTGGKGVLTCTFGGYDHCHNEQEVHKRIGYNKDADPAYTSSSIFCAKGKGYSVPWDQAEEHMHCM